ncbi:coiled-coil domain-containing protein 81-like [Harpia harpyja]|uniref:coiled-coil domain-containing protein 81-like n=1 Tax=Harpia harpyja TaxID=202280 RepID=UPI0022B150DE|nr:coiled-coil domain-containing protein 81-like [Harpia harpyja]
MAKDLFLRPHLSPTTEKLKSTEFVKIWASTSCYLSQQLALHQVGLTSFSSPHILTKVDEVLTDLCHGVQLVCPSFERRNNAPARPCNAQMCNGPPPLSIRMYNKVQAWCHKKGWFPKSPPCSFVPQAWAGHSAPSPFSDKSSICPSKTSDPPPPLFQAVRIPGLGTFVVVRERVVSKEKDPVVVERPVFHLANAIARDHGLRYGCIDVPGHQHFEQLPYAQIASDNAVSEGTVQLCVERTMRLFRVCLENRDNVALVWRDVGMLIIQGRDVKMRFYTDFLKRLNGTDQMLQAVLEMPEMRDSVISRHDTAASQTSSGRVVVLPGYKLETVPKMPTVKADLTGHVKATPEKGWGKGDGSGKKEDLAEQRLLRRARLSPKRLPAATVKSEQGQKAEGREPRARQLPAIQGSSLKEKEEKEKQKLIPLVEPRTVDFIARAIERREKNKHLKRKEKLPEHIQKYLDKEEKEKTELAEEEKSKLQTRPVTKKKAKSEKETVRSSRPIIDKFFISS